MEFDPKKLVYKTDGTPFLSTAQIEEVATEVLQTYCHHVLLKPSMTPVLDIIARLGEKTRLHFAIADLIHKGMVKVLGKVNFTTRTLTLDTSLVSGDRIVQFRFTAAHEIGHWILHRWNYKKWQFEPGITEHDNLEDNEATLCRLEQKSPQDWLEWQANVFAAQLIMPRLTFREALIQTQTTLEMPRVGEVWLCDEHYSRKDFQILANVLANIFGVSKESIRVRLATLGFLHDQTSDNLHSTKQILSTGAYT